MKKINELPTASDINDDTMFEISSKTGTNIFNSNRITFSALYNEIENRIRQKIENCDYNLCECVDNVPVPPDPPVVVPPSPSYAQGIIAMFYHQSRGINFLSKYGGVSNPYRIPDAVSVKMDWMKAAQNASILTPATSIINYKTSGSSWFPGEAKLPTGTVYPYSTATMKFTEPGIGRTSMGRYFGYINIETAGNYGFSYAGEEGGTMWMALIPGTNPNQYKPGTIMKPFINADNNDTDGVGWRYMASAQTQKGSHYLNFYTMYNSTTTTFKTAVDATTTETDLKKKRVYLEAGLYPFMMDLWGGGDKSGETTQIKWMTPSSTTYVHIPGDKLLYKLSDWTDAIASLKTKLTIKPTSADSPLYHPTDYAYGTVSYTAKLPVGTPTPSFVPPHEYGP